MLSDSHDADAFDCNNVCRSKCVMLLKQKLIKRLVKGKMIEEMTDNDTYFLDQDLSLNIQLVTHN